MTSQVRPTYQAIIDAAVTATDASSGWLLATEPDGLRVMSISGSTAGQTALGTLVEPTGAKGFVLSSGQPTALMPQPTDTANNGAAGAAGVPASVLAAPCGDEDVVGVIEVAGKAGGLAFGFDDIDALSGLALVASAALAESGHAHVEVAPPAALARELEQLAQHDPGRYASLAQVIEALLGIGA